MDVEKSTERRHRHRKTGGRKRSSRPDKENTESQWISTTTSSQSEGKSDSSNSAGGSSIEIPKSDEDLTCQRWETRPTPPIELCTPSHSASVISNSVQSPLSEPPDRLSQETSLLDTQSTPTISKTETETERKVKRKRKKFESSHHSSDSGGNSPQSHTNPSSSADELSTCVTESEMCDIYKDCYYNPIHLPLSNELYTPAYCVHVTDTCDVDKGVEQSLAVAYQTGTHVHNEDIPITQAEDENRSKSVHIGEDNAHKNKVDLRYHEVKQSHNIEKQVADRLTVPKEEVPEISLNIPQNNASICETLENVESSPVGVRLQIDAHKKSLQEIEAIPESLKKGDLTTKLDNTGEDKSTHKWKKKFGWPKGNLEFGKGNYDPANALRTYDDNTQKDVQLIRVYKREESKEEQTELDKKEPEVVNETPRSAKKNAEMNDLSAVSVEAPKFGIRFNRKKKKFNDTQSENGSTLNNNQREQSPHEKPNTQSKTLRFTIGEKLKIGPHKTKNTVNLSVNQMPHVTTEVTDVQNPIEEPQIKIPEGKEFKIGTEKYLFEKEYNAFASDEIQNTLAEKATDKANETTERKESVEENIQEKYNQQGAPKEKRAQETRQKKNVIEAFRLKEILLQINQANEQESNRGKNDVEKNGKYQQTYEDTAKKQHDKREAENPDVDDLLPGAEVSVPSKKFGFGFSFGGKGKKGSLKVKKPKVSGEAGVDLSAGADVRAPDVDVDLHAGGDAKSGGLKFPKISMPTFKLGAGHPHADVDVSLPDASVSVSGPTVDLPSLKAEVDVPDVDLRLPDVSTTGDLSAQVGLDGVPSAEFGADLKLPDMGVSGEVSAPAMGSDMPIRDVGLPADLIVSSPELLPSICSIPVDSAAVFHGSPVFPDFALFVSPSVLPSGKFVTPVTHVTSDSSSRVFSPPHSDGILGDSSSFPSRLSPNVVADDMEVFDSTDIELRPLNFTFDHGDPAGSVGGTVESSPTKTSLSHHQRYNFSLSRLFGSLHRRKRKTPERHQVPGANEYPNHPKTVVSKASEKLQADDSSVEATKSSPYTTPTPMQRSSLPKSRDSVIRQTWHGDDDRLNLSEEARHLADSDEAPQLPPTPTGVRIKPVLKDPGNLLEVRRRGTADSSKPRPWSTLECPPFGCVFVNDDYLFPDALTPTKIPSFRGSKDAVYNVPYMDDKAIPSEEPEWPIGESRRTLLSQLSQNSGSLARIAAEESSIISLAKLRSFFSRSGSTDDKENRYHNTEGRSRAGRLFGKKKKTTSHSKQDEKSDKGARSTSGSRSSGRFATWRSRQGRVHQ